MASTSNGISTGTGLVARPANCCDITPLSRARMGCTARLALASRDFADIAVGGWASAVDNVVIAAGQSTGANDRRGDLTSCAALPALTRTSSKPGINPTALTRRSHGDHSPRAK